MGFRIRAHVQQAPDALAKVLAHGSGVGPLITWTNRFQITHADRAIWSHGFVVFDVAGSLNSVWAETYEESLTIRDNLRHGASLTDILGLLEPVGDL